jgi:flagellum-specific ATP synthase
MTALELLERAIALAEQRGPLVRVGGSITELSPTSIQISGLSRSAQIGDHVEIVAANDVFRAEVIQIDGNSITAKPFDSAPKVGLGAVAWHNGQFLISPHDSWRGRTIDSLARPLDGQGALTKGVAALPVDRGPPSALQRERITAPVRTGVRVIDIFTPICVGQRIGIFAGSGVGKSTLLSMLARSLEFDSVVLALVGERGREVREFLEGLDPVVRDRTVSVVSTGDQSPSMRRLAPQTAMTIAEYLRDTGLNVLLVIDSVTRYAHASREVALAAGEAPVARGYPPSVFTDLPRLLERAGPGEIGKGSITGLFSVLVDGDDHNDPIADSVRGILDGHVVLDRTIAEQGRYPAINPLTSISRMAHIAWSPDQRELVLKLRAMLSRFEETRDLRLMGGYREGIDGELDRAVAIMPKLIEALKQAPQDKVSVDAFMEVSRALQAT